MKLRTDFVSNSSSSSFIVIAEDGNDLTSTISTRHNNSYHVFPDTAYKHQFGWEFEDTHDFYSKLNFIGIQLLNMLAMHIEKHCDLYEDTYNRLAENPYADKFEKCYDMVKKVCKEKFGIKVSLDEDLLKLCTYDGNDGKLKVYVTICSDVYIDHQSCVTEGECMEMFETEQKLYDFLRFEKSYIRGGNDNV